MDSFNSSIEKTSNTNSPYLKVNYVLFDIEYGKHTNCCTHSTSVGYDGPQYGADGLLQQVLILLGFFLEIPFLSLADDVICFCVCRTYSFLLMLKSLNSFPQPDRQCKHPRPV